MAKTDAELFRTLGEQNSAVRSMVEDLTTAEESRSATGALAPQSLLPEEECQLKALKARFPRAADAQAWAEQQLGPAPRKATWAVLEQTFRTGAWPVKASSSRAAKATGVTSQDLDDRLAALEQRLMTRLDALEILIQGQGAP
ncbi:hypothetical protein NZK33_16445 [Cyanobium sp. FGCU-6]|nr:hypothetical protein [Cyanobium sp. FGCU6]